jgi:molybdenum cofactor cytidylyltransferase
MKCETAPATAIILAAGESRRMGEPKQLLPFAGKTMLQCVIDALPVEQRLVVLGYRADEIAARIHGARVVHNPRYRRGMFSSVQAGLRALPERTQVVLIALCDQPRLQPATVERLRREFTGKILIPTHGGRQGHPLLFDSRYVREILAMDESLTLKHFLANHPDEITRLAVEDDGVLLDIDERADYERALKAH